MENQLSIALKNNVLFKDIDFNEINLNEIKGTLSTLQEGEILYREGAPVNHIYFIVSGEVNLLKKSNVGKTKSFIFSENEFFGHDEYLDNGNRLSTVVALQDAYLIGLSKTEMDSLILQDRQIKDELDYHRIEELRINEPSVTDDFSTTVQNAFTSDIKISEDKESNKTEKLDDISFEYNSNTIDEKITDEKPVVQEEEPISFDALHSEIDQIPGEESQQDDAESNHQQIELNDNDVTFSLTDLDESIIESETTADSTEEMDPVTNLETENKSEPELEDKFQNHNEPIKTQFEELSETPLNKEIENFDSPDAYEDETDDVEFTIPKTEIPNDETFNDENDLSFLTDDDQEVENTSEDDFLNGISSEDELRKIDALINANSSEQENKPEEMTEQFPEEFSVTKQIEPEQEIDEKLDQLLGLTNTPIDENSSEDDFNLEFEDTISFDEPSTLSSEESEKANEEEVEINNKKVNEFDLANLNNEELPTDVTLNEPPVDFDEQNGSIDESSIEKDVTNEFDLADLYKENSPTENAQEKVIESGTLLEADSDEKDDLILDPIPVDPIISKIKNDEPEVEVANNINQPVLEPNDEASQIELKSDEPNLSASQLRMIIKAAELVNSDLKIDDLLIRIVDVAASLIDADRGTLYIVENEKNELWSKVATGNEVKEYHLKIGEGIAGWVAQSGEIVNIKDAQEDERFNNEYDIASGYLTKSMLCFPVKNKEGIIVSVIQLLNSKNGTFSKLDEEMLTAISLQIALALEKATLLEKLLQGERVSSLGKMANFLIQDIKKPILVSKRYSDHLREKDLPADIKQVLEMMTDQLNHVADIVQTTSSYSQGNVVLRTQETNISTLMADFVNRIDSYLRTKNCQIINEADTNANVKIDAKEFYQCFNHIIKNACDAMPDGGNIVLSSKLDNDKVVLTFKDQGLGIPENLKEKVFEPFMSHGKKEGTGLGLSITKKVVEHHGGSIEIESTLGSGATIMIKLPVVSPY